MPPFSREKTDLIKQKITFMNRLIALACLSLLPGTYAAAEGFQVNAQSTKQAGMGHVGTAMKLGAESMHFNPAGLAFMNKAVDLSVGVSGVFSYLKYEKDSYSFKSDNKPSTPLYLYAGFKIYDNLAAGIAFNTPYGSSITWGENWKGAHLVQNISLKAFNIQPTISWKITDKLSIGAGLMMDFGNIQLNRALIGPGELTHMANYMQSALAEKLPPQMVEAMKPMIAPLIKEFSVYDDASAASAQLKGDARIRYGFNIGAMYDINEKFTVGVSYRSKITAKVKEGEVDPKYANEEHFIGMLEQVNKLLQAVNTMTGGATNLPSSIGIPPLNTGTFSAELPLVSNLNFGVTYKPNKDWIVSGDLQWVGWGAYDALDVHFSPSSLSAYDIHAEKKYHNSCIFRVGAQYAATNRLDVRLGSYFDMSPVKDDYLNPETPSMNKLGITAGCSFRPADHFSVDLSFSYVTGFGRDGSYTDEYMLMKTIKDLPDQYKQRVFSGHYSAYALMPSIGISYSF